MSAPYVAMPEPIFLDRGDATILGSLYRPTGEGQFPTLLYAAGFPSPHIDASDLANSIRATGWNVVTFRYRGTWESTGVPSLDAWTNDIRALADFTLGDRAADAKRFALAGTSFGALLVARHATNDDRVTDVLLLSPRVKRSMSGAHSWPAATATRCRRRTLRSSWSRREQSGFATGEPIMVSRGTASS